MEELPGNSTELKSSEIREFQNVYSPGTLLGVYAAALRSPVEGRVVLARGIFQASPSARVYNDYYYDTIRSVYENKAVKARIPALLRNKLENNQVYLFRGYVEKKLTLSAIELQFVVDEVLQKEENNVSEEEVKRFQLVQQKLALGYRDFEKLVREHVHQNRIIRIVNVYGNGAIVHKDFEKGLAEACARFEIIEHRCNFASRAQIIQTIVGFSGADVSAVALVRGGGDAASLEIFNDTEVGAATLKLNPLFVTALGHTVNETLADKLADRKFALPHDYGNTLKEWVNHAVEEQARSKSLFIDQVKQDLAKTFGEQIRTLQQQLETRNKEFAGAELKFRELTEHLQKDKTDTLAARDAAFSAQLKALSEQLLQKEQDAKVLSEQYETTTREKVNAATIEVKTRFELLGEQNRKLQNALTRTIVFLAITVIAAIIFAALVFARS